MFFRNYVDVLFYQQTVDKRRRKRVIDDSQYAPGEETAPLNAPRWTKSGYAGSMVQTVAKAAQKYDDNVTDNTEHTRHHSRKKSKSDEDNN
jgi:hypothetical protein